MDGRIIPTRPGMMVERRGRAIIQEMMSMRSTGEGYRAITKWLNENRFEYSRTGTWNAKTVRKVILREQQGGSA